MQRLVGHRLGRYEVVAFLGAGGMGSVYRARDLELAREVAIKVLPEGFRDDPERLQRFDREIRAAARLSHPNVVEIHDFGTCDGIVYAVMELLKGHTLRERLSGKPIPLPTAFEIGAAIANGLGAAHHEGILHRDVKPENVFITRDGTVKLLDFGLARQVDRRDPDAETASIASDLTSSGKVVGTTAYMSPEQLRGRTLDQRSDIFSLGCVLYEMLTGQHPFRRETGADTVSAILGEEPQPLAELRSDLPPGIDLVVARCLAKHPDERFESARDVAFALTAISESGVDHRPEVERPVSIKRRTIRRAERAGILVILAALALTAWRFSDRLWPRPLPLPERPQVAVLDLTAANDTPHAREVAAGLTRTLADGVALFEKRVSGGGLWAFPRPEPPNQLLPLADLAKVYAVNLGLEGDVGVTADQISVRLRLASPDGALLRQRIVRESLGNVAALQVQPVLAARALLGLPADPAIETLLTQRATTITAAFTSYLEGVGAAALAREPSEVEGAYAALEKAIASDPLFSAARIQAARVALRLYQAEGGEQWLERARGDAERAAADAAVAIEALRLVAKIETAAGRHEAALTALEKAVHAAPGDADACLELAQAYAAAGRVDEARRGFERSIYLRPGYWPTRHWLAMMYWGLGQYEAAANQFREVVAAAPRYQGGYNNLAQMYYFLGQLDHAAQASRRSLEITPDGNWYAYTNLCEVYFEQARYADSVQMCEQALALEPEDYDSWGNLGYARLYGSDPGAAAEPFARAIELAEAARAGAPSDASVLIRLAGFYAATDQLTAGRERLEAAVAMAPTDPQLIAQIAESYEDLHDRDRALAWVEKAFGAGIGPAYFARRPALRDLVTDPRYQRLVAGEPSPPPGREKGEPS